MAARPIWIGTGVLVVATLAGCATGSSTGARGTVTVTVNPTPMPTASVALTSTTSASASTGIPPTSSAPTHLTTLGATCDSDLTVYDVQNAVGHTIKGRTAFVRGVAEPDIGRLTYLNCRYGITSAAAAPGLEVGVSLYATAAKAAARITATVSDYENHGATGTPVTVDGVAATLLQGGAGSDYSVPTLVLASGQRTVAVSATATVVPTADRTKDLTAVAALALTRTGG